MPKQKSSSKNGNEEYIKDNFIYNGEDDTYTCPDGIILKNVSNPESKSQIYKNTETCKKMQK